MEEFPDFDSFLDSQQNFGSAIAGLPTTGGIGFAGDEDWFEVELIAGHEYEIQLRGSPTNDGTLSDPLFIGVYDLNGILVPESGDDDSGTDFNSLAFFTASYTGTHYFSAGAFGDEGSSFNTGTYTLEYFDWSLSEVVNEGDDITFSIPTDIPGELSEFLGSSSSPDEYISDRQISVMVTSASAINGEDFTVSYTFGQTQSLNFAALMDDLVEDDESVSVRVVGTVDWIIPNFDGSPETNLLGGSVTGFTETATIDFTRNFTINSAPYGVPDPIQNYTFTEPGVIGNVLTNFADGSEELFDAVPFSFEAPTIVGELLANGDLFITDATAASGQNIVVRFDVIDERGAITQSEQIIEFGDLGDDYLPGDAAEAFGSVLVDVPTSGNIESEGDRDRFDVILQAGVEYNISVEGSSTDGGSLQDPEIVGIYNILGGLVPGSSDDNGGVETNAQIDGFTVLVDSTYQIEVASSGDLGVGDYILNVEFVRVLDDFLPGPFGDFGSVDIGVPTSGNIETEGDRDRFDVTLQAGVLYNISLEGSSTGGGSLVNPEIIGVFNSLGQRVAGGANNDGGVGANALVEGFVVDADGTYQIEVASAQAGNLGDYTLTVGSTGFVDDFLPGISGGFGTVAIGGRATGEIEASGDIDGFRVSLQANTTYEISILGSDSNNGTLLDPGLLGVFTSSNLDGTPVSSVQTLNTQLVGDDSVSYFTPQSPGEVFIGVQDASGGVGTYTVAVENIGVRDDYAADIDTTGSITPGGSATGRVDFAQDNDWFEVSLSANRLYEIELVPTNNANAIADPFFTGVYDSNGNLIENTDNDDGGGGTSSALQFVTDDPGIFYLSAGGFGDATGQYRLELNDLGPLDDNSFDITFEFTSDDVPNSYINAFEGAAERWEEIITGDLDYAFVEGYGFVDDVLIEVAVEDIDLTFEGVSQEILAISSVLDQRDDSNALPTYSRIVINEPAVGLLRNLDEFVSNTIGRALGFGSLWEERGLVRDIEGVATYTGSNALREMVELSDDLNGVNVLEDGENGALAAEYWSEENLDGELMTSRVELRRSSDGEAPFGRLDNPISELTVAAMQDLGYEVDYGAADLYRLPIGPLSRQSNVEVNTQTQTSGTGPRASQRLLNDLPDNDEIPNGTAYIYTRPSVLSESLASFALTNANSELITATGTNAVFLEGVTGENFVVELRGTFEKNTPATVNNLVGTVDSMEVRSFTGLLLFSVDYTQNPATVTEVISQWPNYSMDDENVIIIDSLDGTVARVNPNGGGENASRIFSGASDDYVRGGAMAELIHGGSGDDTVMGGAGNDVLEGGGGLDTAVYSGDQSSYTLEFSPTGTTITDRRTSEDGTDTLVNVELLEFADGTFDIGIRSGAVGLSTEDFASIVELYIAYFNRAPAALGLLYWATRLEDGMTLPQIAQSFFEQPEIQRTYEAYLNADGSLNDTEAFVTAVFNNVLGRDPSGPYWINELETNPAITPAIFILSVLNGAKAPTGGAGDRAYLGDKTDIGVYFSAVKGLSEFDDTVSVMSTYDGSDASVTSAVAAIDQIYAEALNPNSGEFLMPLVGVIDDPFAAA